MIQAAWNDFNNQDIFKEGDVIALITGPLNATDTVAVRDLLRQAEYSEDAADFIKRVELGNFTSNQQRAKLGVFKSHLKVANGNIALTNDQLWRFLKSFRLLICDLDDINGVTLSLLHSLIAQWSQEDVNTLWTQLKDRIEWKNENAGFITIESIPADIRSAFQRRTAETIPSELTRIPLPREERDWNQTQYASELAIVNLLGSWNEKSDADMVIAAQLAKEDFTDWIAKVREILQQPESPVVLENGIWSVTEREEVWQAMASRIFDDNLDILRQCVVAVLTERDPQFDMPREERYLANIQGKVLKHSHYLRKGLAESLALLGSQSSALINCSLNKPETIAILAVREIFQNSDWVLWGSLNNLLPLFAEAAPEAFLSVVEAALEQTPCP
ncbi:MAG: hypothetical protein AB1589_45055, partial [Cyanobacteriota bacterium]